jgi:hypothetical protein
MPNASGLVGILVTGSLLVSLGEGEETEGAPFMPLGKAAQLEQIQGVTQW